MPTCTQVGVESGTKNGMVIMAKIRVTNTGKKADGEICWKVERKFGVLCFKGWRDAGYVWAINPDDALRMAGGEK